MSALKEAMGVVRDAIKLTDEVKKVSESLKEITREMRDQDRRITRLEAQWETAMAFSAMQSSVTRLPRDRK